MLLDQFYQNDKPKQTLVNFITDGRLPHTVLLEGEDGCGKTTFARMMAAAVLCQQPDVAQRPCGECRNCRLILEDNHPDVVIEQSENKANAFHVDQIRELRAGAYIRPNDGDYKVYILRNVHNMTEQAQNALLKIIEEPPERVLFILTCNNRARILPTILSRAAVIPIAVCSQEECLRALGRLAPQADEQRRQQAAEFAQGNIGKALQILQDEAKLKLACDARRIGQMICIGQEFELLSSLQEYTGGKKREEFLALLQEVRAYFLELMRVQSGVTCVHEEIPLAVKNRFSTLQAMRILDIIDRTAAQVTQNVSLSLAAAAFCAGAKAAQQ